MKHLVENASWNFDLVLNYFEDTDAPTLASLNMCSLHVHLDDIQQDEDIMDNMVILLQETHKKFLFSECMFPYIILNSTYSIRGVLTCIKNRYTYLKQKTFVMQKLSL